MGVTARITAILAFLLLSAVCTVAQAATDICPNNILPESAKPSQNNNANNLVVNKICYVSANTPYYYSTINIVSNGALVFDEVHGVAPSAAASAATNIWASAIIIENGGKLVAGHDCPNAACSGRFGQKFNNLTIHIYGNDTAKWDRATNKFTAQNLGATCYGATCGVDSTTWSKLKYEPLRSEAKCTDRNIWPACGSGARVGYFGSKVLAVSYGGTLDLQGYKGASDESVKELDPTDSGVSWMRLADSDTGTLEPKADSLAIEKDPLGKWADGDEFVVTTTDYLPGHSEKHTISYIKGTRIEIRDNPNLTPKVVANPILYSHNSRRYGGPRDADGKQWAKTNTSGLGRLPDRLIAKADGTPNSVGGAIDPELVKSGAETRAAVALLTRSIRIVSGGNKAGDDFPTAYQADGKTVKPCTITNPATGATDGSLSCYHFGAHLIVREGFAAVHVSGVEFKQMGQGGRMGHYPVHFHMVGKAPDGTYVKDSSINESMTRFIVLHASQNVTLARNVGYLSIGHGFYLEDASEAYNRLYSNIGIFARAAINNEQNVRKVPGIIALNTFDDTTGKYTHVIYRSDVFHPTVFWITNGFNDFVGNMAAGANACGAAYWLIPASIKDMAPTSQDQVQGYESTQWNNDRAGMAPLKTFYKNYATTAMHSFQTTPDAPSCMGFGFGPAVPANYGPQQIVVRGVLSEAPMPSGTQSSEMYYPHIGGEQRPTICPDDKCTKVTACANSGLAVSNCTANVIDHYTSAYHWAEGNTSAIWLRYKWFLFDNSVLSDVQQGGITFVTGGDFTRSSVPEGYWGVARNSIFVGNTRDNSAYPYSSNKGPYPTEDFKCTPIGAGTPDFCIDARAGISMQYGGFFTNQRLANIYDGPSYQDSVAYLDVKTADCDRENGSNFNTKCIYGNHNAQLLLRKSPGVNDNKCYVPNAALAWKHPNGFYYPPGFHLKNLFFDQVDLRHFVVVPLFAPPGKYVRENKQWILNKDFKNDFGQGGTYLTDTQEVEKQYCGGGSIFNSFSAIDRQTELNDDDGSTTGLSNDFSDANYPDPRLKQTISINQDFFFGAPVDTPECASAREPFSPTAGPGNANPAHACAATETTKALPTARTSPYDYLTTVVASRYDTADNHEKDPPWSKECSNSNCYGLPLYRQYLTSSEKKLWDDNCKTKTDDARAQTLADPLECRWPFIRMAGASIGARQTITINNGLYYIDTTKSKEQQDGEDLNFDVIPRTYSVVSPKTSQLVDGKFYVFFVFAKQSTVQTYDIYVGKSFKIAADASSDLKLLHMKVPGIQWWNQATEENVPSVVAGQGSGKWIESAKLDAATGILRVTVNFKGQTELNPVTSDETCRPKMFCERVGGNCVANKSNPTYVNAIKFNKAITSEMEFVCGKWAVKDLDCPNDGCLGFTLQLHDPVADGKYHRPAPELFPSGAVTSLTQGAPSWATKFDASSIPQPDNAAGGQCHYPKLPPCSSP